MAMFSPECFNPGKFMNEEGRPDCQDGKHTHLFPEGVPDNPELAETYYSQFDDEFEDVDEEGDAEDGEGTLLATVLGAASNEATGDDEVGDLIQHMQSALSKDDTGFCLSMLLPKKYHCVSAVGRCQRDKMKHKAAKILEQKISSAVFLSAQSLSKLFCLFSKKCNNQRRHVRSVWTKSARTANSPPKGVSFGCLASLNFVFFLLKELLVLRIGVWSAEV